MTLFLGISKGNMMSFTTFQKQPAEVFCKKKVFLKILQISQENTCVEDLRACNFNTKVVAFVWLLQNKHKIDDFS